MKEEGRPLLQMITTKGVFKESPPLLTNLKLKELGVIGIFEIYLTRCKCKESYRLIKQAYQLEDVRTMS